MSSRFITEGGTPITPELATDLRQLVFGTSSIPMRAEWTQTPFTFGAPKEELSYGLRSPRNATRGLLSVVQGFILKYLLFGRRGRNNQDPLLCTQEMQTNALINALVEILRIISDKGKVTMVLPSPDDEVFVEHSVTFFHDSITEKAIPQYGILSRCTIGLLLWDNDNTQPSVAATRQPGSRLKTPNFPIWITSCCGHYGVAFNRNPELLRNYHAESRFDLNYYSCSGHNVFMTIDNRVYNEQATGMLERQATTEGGTATMTAGGGRRDDEAGGGDNADLLVREELTMNTPLQRLIHTKWEEAHIRFNVQPSMLSYLFCTTP